MSNIKFTYLDKIIHEMNSPIQAIALLSEVMLLGKHCQTNEDYVKNVECINDSVEKLKRIMNLLSTITNLKSDKINIQLEEVDLIALVKQEIKYHQVRNTPNHNLKIDWNNKILSCKAIVDEFWFKQLLANLIMNAINHCGSGLIEIHTKTVKKDGIDHFCLTVSDEGCGIPENELETIFRPLERGSHSIEKMIPGSGIGLAIAKEIVEAHGGGILAKNNSKVGAVFEVLIPLKS